MQATLDQNLINFLFDYMGGRVEIDKCEAEQRTMSYPGRPASLELGLVGRIAAEKVLNEFPGYSIQDVMDMVNEVIADWRNNEASEDWFFGTMKRGAREYMDRDWKSEEVIFSHRAGSFYLEATFQ